MIRLIYVWYDVVGDVVVCSYVVVTVCGVVALYVYVVVFVVVVVVVVVVVCV